MGGRRQVWAWAWPLLLATHGLCFSPQFSAPVKNVTVARGRDAKFTCLVKHLGGYRVGWVKADTKAIQAIHTHVITHNPRVDVTFDDHSTWHLIIRQVTEDDQGPYMCQINTDPMTSQLGYLEVLRPPEIDDNQSSADVVVTEGEPATLKCVANGHPQPTITWVREDAENIMMSDGVVTKSVKNWEGEELHLKRVSRDDMAAYLCIARNTVPPRVSKRVMLHVHFHPIIHVPNQLIGSPYGTDVNLECKVEASPKPVTFWSNKQGDMLMSSSKYQVLEELKKPGGYAVHMKLVIRDLTQQDIGKYSCVAKNSIGEVESNINVYYIAPATTTPPRLPAFVETNRLEDGDSYYPGGPLEGHEDPLLPPGSPYEGSGGLEWSRPKFYPTSDEGRYSGMNNWLPENSEVESNLGIGGGGGGGGGGSSSSSSLDTVGFSSGARGVVLDGALVACVGVVVRASVWRMLV